MKKFSKLEYARPNFETFKKDYSECVRKIEFAKDYDTQKESIYEINRLYKEFLTLRNIISIRYSIDTRDKFYAEENNIFVDKTDNDVNTETQTRK